MTNQFREYTFKEEVESVGFEIMKLSQFFTEQKFDEIAIPHKIHFYLILFITEGIGEHVIDFKTYKYGKGSILFVEQNQVHAWKKAENVKGFLVLFTQEYLFNNQVKFQDISYSFPYNNSLYDPIIKLSEEHYEPFHALISYLFLEYYLEDSLVKQEILQNLLRTTLLKIRSYPTKEHKDIDSEDKDLFIRFQKLLEKRVHLTRNATDYCTELNVPYRKLNQTCKTLTNKTIKQFIDELLIIKAKRLLSEKDNNISQTAYSIGFNEVTNFTKFFKKHSNQTPKSFIKSIS